MPPEAWQWRLKENTESGGIRGFDTFDHGHHLWTTAWYLCGSVERASGWIDSIDGIIDAPSVMIWKHTSGVYGSIEFVHMPALTIPSKYYANDKWIEVSGTQGIVVIHKSLMLHSHRYIIIYSIGKTLRQQNRQKRVFLSALDCVATLLNMRHGQRN